MQNANAIVFIVINIKGNYFWRKPFLWMDF